MENIGWEELQELEKLEQELTQLHSFNSSFGSESNQHNIYIGSALDSNNDPLGLMQTMDPHDEQHHQIDSPTEDDNHQLELDQMKALENLTIDSFIDPNQQTFPSVAPPAPIQSSPLSSFHQTPFTPANENKQKNNELSFYRGNDNNSPIIPGGREEKSFSSPIINTLNDDQMHQYQSRISTLERINEQLIQEKSELVQKLSRSDSSIAAIKAALQKEHQMDLLQMKKELFEQKERQLENLRFEMKAERETIESRLQDQMEIREQQWRHERSLLEQELEYYKKNSNRHNNVYVDTFTQTNNDEASLSELRRMNAELQESESDLKLTLAQQEIELSNKEAELLTKREEIEKLLNKVTSLEKRLKKKIPDPLQAIGGNKENEVVDAETIAREIEQRYAKAYDSAIQHLKSSYSNLTNKLREKTEQAQEEAVMRVRNELEKALELKENELINERSEVQLLKTHVGELMIQLEKQREQHHLSMEQMKNQYLKTLRQMRDDVASSKARSVERVREAWAKKREDLERAWKQRFDELKREYEQRLESKQIMMMY